MKVLSIDLDFLYPELEDKKKVFTKEIPSTKYWDEFAGQHNINLKSLAPNFNAKLLVDIIIRSIKKNNGNIENMYANHVVI